MADNIKIVGNIISTTTVSRYNDKDTSLILSRNLQEYFGGENDYIEFYAYDIGGRLLINNLNYSDYKLLPSTGLKPATETFPNTTGNIQTENVGISSTLSPSTGSTIPIIEIDPINDLKNIGYSSGEFTVKYNLFENKLSNSRDRALFVKEISSDRTEIRLASTTLTNDEIENVVNSMIDEINNSPYYVDYLLNFGDNKQYVAVNVALNKASTGYEVLFKLYEPLPIEIQEKDVLWVVNEKVNPYTFDINLDKIITPPPAPTLRGPNFDVPVKEGGTVATSYTNYQTALGSLQSLQSSSYNQIQNLLNTQSIQINVNYEVSESTDFNNFVFFGSAYQRITNFYTKAKQIEDYNTLINKYKPFVSTTSSLQTEINLYSSSINTLISQFDGFETYLYFESSSYAWPKSGSLKPYSLLSTGSATVINWYGNLTSSAQTYDLNNPNNLEYIVPNYIRDDENNTPYIVFLNMIGQYFDNIWIYLKAITDINLANNNLNYGISKDIVYEQLKSLGIKLYNSQAGEALDSFLIGANTGSTIWSDDFSPTSSYLNNIPRKDLVSELYKRIYHNLPLLLKTKGTVEGLDNLMTVFGVPNRTYYTIGSSSFYTPTGSNLTASILDVKEYGGSLKSGLIKGYNNDKVRIVSNEIVTGSVLSPIMSLQTYTTASSQFRDDDLHFVDISFSPQNQINTYISGAISSSNATWSLDDFIGDPRYAYSSSYIPLDTERTKYYQVGVSGYAPFTASALDYNGFIRLIEFFDNALFKMLGDFVPERTSLSTGVTFESPVLERNKAVYANPTSTTTQSVYEANYSASGISSDYGHFYDALGDDKKAWYDGNISGSYIDVYDYFENSHPNPYLQADSSSFTTQNIYTFQHSDFNVLFNNVSKSVESLNRKKIEYVWGTTSSILTTPELQDSYLNLQSYNTSRYEGSKTYSLKYNTYTSASLIVDYSILNVSYSLISSSYDWNNVLNGAFIGNPYYTTLFLTGSATQLANIVNILDQSDLDYISISNPDPFISNTVTEKIYKVYVYYYYRFLDFGPPIIDITDYTKLALALSPALKTGFPPADTGEQPTISSDYGPGTLNLTFYKNYLGDKSYGKTTSIDRNSYKLGWVRTIQSQSLNFYEKTTFNLKYLIDPNYQITELSYNNPNLFEVQNIFKSGTPVRVSVTNVNSPSSQVTLDGTKTIFRGGYRFDPIIFRENGEKLTFTFNESVSQSTDYLGITARNDYYYQYYAIGGSNHGNRGLLDYQQPSNQPGSYTYTSTDPNINLSTAMATRYDSSQWLSGRSSISNSDKTNFVFPTYGVFTDIESYRLGYYAYEFNQIRFPVVINNDEPGTDTYSDGDDYVYKVPRTSNNYKISGQIPFYFEGDDSPEIWRTPLDEWGQLRVNFKVVATVEKNNDLVNGTWELIASSSLEQISSSPYTIIDVNTNTINWNYNAWGFYKCKFDTTTSLNQGDYIRVRFYLLTITNLFGVGDDGGFNRHPGVGRYFSFRIGGDGPFPNANYTNDRKSIISIEDKNTAYEIYTYTSSYDNNSGPFFSTGSEPNSIILSNTAVSYINSSSVFTPSLETDTRNYYTQIIDNFGIQKYDLFRFGPFKQNKPSYYTVIDVKTGLKGDITTIPGTFAGGTGLYAIFQFFIYDYSYYTPSLFELGDILNISSTTSNNRSNVRVIGSYINSANNTVAVWFATSPAFSNTTSPETPTFKFTSPAKCRIYFDKNLDTASISPSNFAILRPKPDETTVIVEHKKFPGQVSQTLLIPEDANKLLKDNAGSIFDRFNEKLNPNTSNE